MKRILPEFEYSSEQLNIIENLAVSTGLCSDTVKILYGRGIDDEEKIERFLHPSKSNFISPYKMSGMKEAVELITRARDEEWVVVVYGDYDADGVCASSIMRGVLKDFGIEPIVYVPERRNGYGLNTSAIDEIFEEYFPQLFITVDCGISNAEEVEYIKEQGAEVIVTDHHELPSALPDCICVNPKFNDGYPYDNLCGAGVAFKVGCALNGTDAYKYLDYAAIATVADSVPLWGENRDIVAEGLKIINKTPKKAYSAFLNKSGEAVTAQSLAFSIAPKINAAGRMGDANAALRLFCEEDEKAIFDLSVQLTAYNTERQKCCDELYLSAKSKLNQKGGGGRVIMLWDESWNAGFVGIVAARLAEEYSRPALLFVKNGDMLKGSARSVESVNIFEALKHCESLIAEFGGHSQAAGVNITEENFPLLEEALNAFLHERYPQGAFTPTLYVCGELTGAASAKFARELDQLEPFGVGFKRPLFTLSVGACQTRPVKALSPHLSVRCPQIELMYFSGARYEKLLKSPVPKKFVFEYNVSNFKGREYVKGFIRDVIYYKESGAFALSQITMNNLSVAALPPVNCNTEIVPIAQIEELALQSEYGTVFIAEEFSTLSAYKAIGDLDVNLFALSSKSLSNVVLVSPQFDCDLSGFNRVIWLDRPASVSLPALEGKTVKICGEIDGAASLKTLSCDRVELLSVFREISANAFNLDGATAEEVAEKNAFGVCPEQALFALKVFEQLNLISFKNGKLTVYRGVKTDLSLSHLYNLINNLN
ncbi:MAG: single-stranded-DNA-specific exonuclease RecJ [Candidatus Coproplasma sp.]